MSLFLETICYQSGHFDRLELHQNRLDRTLFHFFGKNPNINLADLLVPPPILSSQKFKCSIFYNQNKIEEVKYHPYSLRVIKSLKICRNDQIDYQFKYANRLTLDNLSSQRGACDEVLIVKNGLITDIPYGNILFRKGEKWFSPQNPLLWGTRLESYNLKNQIILADIRPDDLYNYSEARIINAMISIEESPKIPIESILF